MSLPEKEFMKLTETKRQKLTVLITSVFPVALFILFLTNSFTKVVASIAFSLCLLLFIIRLFLLKDVVVQQKAKHYYLLMLIYFVAMALSLIYTPDLGDGLMRFQGQTTKLIMAMILIETIASAGEARKYLFAAVAGGTILSLIIIFQQNVLHMPQRGWVWNPVHAGMLLAFSALLALVLVLYEKKAGIRAAVASAFIIHGYALYLNQTRGAWLAFGCAMLILPFVMRSMKPSVKLAYVGMLAIVLVVLLQTPVVRTRIEATIEDLKQTSAVRSETSLGGRYQMWKASTSMFLHNPVLGVGLGGWEPAIREMVKQKVVTSEVLNYNQSHSIYFDVLSTRGIVGCITFIAVVVYPLFYAWRKRDRGVEMFGTLIIVSTMGFLVAGLTDTLVYIRGVFIFYIMLVGTGLAVLMKENSAAPSSDNRKSEAQG